MQMTSTALSLDTELGSVELALELARRSGRARDIVSLEAALRLARQRASRRAQGLSRF
jgi:hypothetical protein